MTIDTATLAAEANSFALTFHTSDATLRRREFTDLPDALAAMSQLLRRPVRHSYLPNADVTLVAVSAMGNDATLCTFSRPLKPTEF